MLVLLLTKLYCTTVGLTYASAARCEAYGLPFRPAVVISVLLVFAGSLLGFVKLVGLVYPAIVYLGFVLMAAIIIALCRQRRARIAQTA
ncbi:hypothetical protein [Pseudomonas putida]|uniref:hypothetical protein n=1 Tax=Pseudomonas putida TaxID=303 RepID=UPI0022641C18|nr:hypothetical protein [Pseudomonas putida]